MRLRDAIDLEFGLCDGRLRQQRESLYQGEITEFDVLGIDVSQPASDDEIAQQLANHGKIGLRRGGSMMAMQSGALMPDSQMVAALDRYFSVVPFSGIPLVRPGASPYAAAGVSPKLTTSASRIMHGRLGWRRRRAAPK